MKISHHKVTLVKRIKVCRNNEPVPTNTLILSFSTPTLPKSVKAGYLRHSVMLSILNPLQCFKCQTFGHGQKTCARPGVNLTTRVKRVKTK